VESETVELDVDLLADQIERRRSGWEAAGFEVGRLTWRCDRMFSDERADCESPHSVGVAVIEDVTRREAIGYVAPLGERGWPREGRLVAWTGGWADADIVNWATDDVAPDVPQFRTVAEFARALDRWFARVSAVAP
jgi:hypothetical protein